MENKGIEQLRVFFRVSNAAFEFSRSFKKAFGLPDEVSKMEELHVLALSEVEKENPDMAVLDYLLKRMQDLAKQNSYDSRNATKQYFENGGKLK